jgi:(1->4)-alpha-D-glucan 1-alpha-D-glucosylmutase
MNDVSTTEHNSLNRLAAATGILPSYFDVHGDEHHTAPATQRALLAAMHINVKTDADVAAALTGLDSREWKRLLPPVRVQSVVDARWSIEATFPKALAAHAFRWTLTSERGESFTGSVAASELTPVDEHAIEGVDYVRARFDLPPNATAAGFGYHRFELEAGDETAAMSLVIAPARCYEPEVFASGGRVWGPAAQLYSVRSRHNWGIGDFTDLAHIAEFAGKLGADVVALNPLHALSSVAPQHASPYNPSSRLFGNPLYIDVEAVPEFEDCAPARRVISSGDTQNKLRWMREGELVGYRITSAGKRYVLELLYQHFRKAHRGTGDKRDREFEAYLASGGEALRKHALFEAIAWKLYGDGVAGAGDWRQWRAGLGDVNSREVAAFADANKERVEFHAWLQWQFDTQLDAAAERAEASGLRIGIAGDLAIGINPGGSECWSDPSLYATAAAVGAPPDLYNTAGQNWGLPPLIPSRLREAAYAPFIATLRRNMRAAGALRIDHVMGLLRLYWVPAGASADAGGYVRYPFDDLLGLLALESQRNRCVVIGEDLGTVPDEARAGLARIGSLSSRPLYFEHDASGEFSPPGAYPRDAVVSVGTHDLATLKGFWVGADIDARESLYAVPQPEHRYAQNVERTGQRRKLLQALQHEGLLPQGIDPYHAAHGEWSPELGLAIVRFLARTPSKILLVSMEDVFGQREQVNLPGTVDELPNWRRKLDRELEDWPEDAAVRWLAEAIRAERPGAGQAPSEVKTP